MKRTMSGYIYLVLLVLLFVDGCGSLIKITETQTIPSQTTLPNSTSLIKTATVSPVRSPTHTPSGTSMTMTQTKIPHPNMQLTFISKIDTGNYGVYAIDIWCLENDQPCFGDPQLLFESTTVINYIAWSPDGTRIAYSGIGMENDFDLFIADWDGKNIINLTNSFGDESSPIWSPDGLLLAYIYGSSRNPAQIRILDFNTGKTTRILENLVNPNFFIWSPNGKLVAYSADVSSTDYHSRITIADVNGIPLKEVPEVSPDDISDGDMSFSSDGQFITFSATISPPMGLSKDNIYIASINDISNLNLVSDLHNSLSPRWSPKGDWIAFTSDESGNYEIYLINPDGTGLRQITHNPAADTNPAWRLLP
jgi:TolB protein